jgi:hypothetical protein
MPDNRRNPAARAAIMRKGGVHNKTNKAKRKKDKQSLKKKIRAESFGSFFVQYAYNYNFSIINSPKTY